MKHQRKIRSEPSLSQFPLDTHSLKLLQPFKTEVLQAWQATMVVKFYKHLQFDKQNCDNVTMLQQYSFPNNYHVKFLSDGWSEHLCCGIVNTFDAREIYLKVWIEHTKTREYLSKSFSHHRYSLIRS